MGNFVYIGGDPATREGFVVDPAFEPEKILAAAKKLGVDVNRVFLTHHHSDHVNGAMYIKARAGAKILAHEGTERFLKGNVSIDQVVTDGEIIKLGKNLTVKIIHTPGHSPGGICLLVADKWLVTGDTLFIGNCGRTDLNGGDSRLLYESLKKIKALPDSLIIFPGHDYGPAKSRTLGEEKKLSPVLKAVAFEDFDALP